MSPCLFSDDGTVTICSPTVIDKKKWRCICPSCTFRTTHVGFFQEWYGWHRTCLNCGEEWQDGEWGERPFEPGWRARNIAAARARWRKHSEKEDL